MPSSATVSSTVESCCRSPTSTVPPGVVNFAPLSTRIHTSWTMASASPAMVASVSPTLGLERDRQLLVRGFNLVQHPIEALAEEADLVPPFRRREPSLEVARSGDRIGGLHHRVERPKRAPRDQPAGEEGRKQRGNRRNDEEATETLEVFALDTGRLAGHHETAQAHVGSGPGRRVQPQLGAC